jgi:hypothetical protein
MLPREGVSQYYGMQTGRTTPAMAQNGHNRGSAAPEVNPGHIVSVKDFSPDTLRNVVAHLKASTSFEHLVYREAELDAIWTITGFFLANEPASRLHDAVKALHAGAEKAHDLVAERRPGAAATVLEEFV